MARINLLPWREELRRLEQRDFLAALSLGLCLTALGMVAVHWAIADRIEYQQQRNRYLSEQIAILDRKIKEIQDLEKQREMLVSRMEIIQQLQISRPEIVHLFDALARTLPEGVHLTKFIQVGDNLEVHGIAQSNARVSAYMRNLEDSPWLEDPRLQIIESKSAAKERQGVFALKFKQEHAKSGDKS
ncbi:PilN domain-containing protein [Methylothermus subterraneus]